MTDDRQVARAIDALRRGWVVRIDGLSLLAVETADEAGLAAFDAGAPADILISGNRAATLKLANQREGTPTGPVRIARAPWIGLAEATAIADPALDLSRRRSRARSGRCRSKRRRLRRRSGWLGLPVSSRLCS